MSKRAKIPAQDLSNIDIHQLLRHRREVAIIWSIEDVKEIRPDLTEDQAWTVLQQCERQHDCNFGITWEHIDWVAENLFPETVEKESS